MTLSPAEARAKNDAMAARLNATTDTHNRDLQTAEARAHVAELGSAMAALDVQRRSQATGTAKSFSTPGMTPLQRGEKLAAILGIKDLRPQREEIDPATLGHLNPARINNGLDVRPPIAGYYQNPDGTDTKIPFIATKFTADGHPAEIRPLVDTPELLAAWNEYQDAAAQGTESLGHRMQRKEIERLMYDEQVDHGKRELGVYDRDLTDIEKDARWQQKLIEQTSALPVSEANCRRLAAQLGLELVWVPMGTAIRNGHEVIQERAYAARVPGTESHFQYGPTSLDQLQSRLDMDIKEKARMAEKARQMETYHKDLWSMPQVTEITVNDKRVSA